MFKTDAVKTFGTVRDLADALGFKSRQAIYKWPRVLTTEQEDRVRGAALRLGKEIHVRKRMERRQSAKAA